QPSKQVLGRQLARQRQARVRYRLEKRAAVCKGAVALDDRCDISLGQAVFEVRGDGKRLWRSKPVNKTKLEPQEFSLNMTGVDVLELRVLAAGNHIGLHAVWIDPRLLQKSDTPDK